MMVLHLLVCYSIIVLLSESDYWPEQNIIVSPFNFQFFKSISPLNWLSAIMIVFVTDFPGNIRVWKKAFVLIPSTLVLIRKSNFYVNGHRLAVPSVQRWNCSSASLVQMVCVSACLHHNFSVVPCCHLLNRDKQHLPSSAGAEVAWHQLSNSSTKTVFRSASTGKST